MKKELVTIKSPIKIIPSKNYLLVIEDADSVRHYWHNEHGKFQNGQYDGWSKSCKLKINKPMIIKSINIQIETGDNNIKVIFLNQEKITQIMKSKDTFSDLVLDIINNTQ